MDKPGATAGIPAEISGPAWQGRSIAGSKLRLVEFSAFLDQQREPDSVCVCLYVLSSPVMLIYCVSIVATKALLIKN